MSKHWRLAPVAALCLMAVPLAAQEQSAPYGPGGRLLQGITLNDQQGSQLDSLRRQHQLQLREMERNRVQTAGGDSAFVKERAQLRDRQMTQARELLGKDEQATFDRNRDRFREQLRAQDGDQLGLMTQERARSQEQLRQGAGQPPAGGQPKPQAGGKPSTSPAGPASPQGGGKGGATQSNKPK